MVLAVLVQLAVPTLRTETGILEWIFLYGLGIFAASSGAAGTVLLALAYAGGWTGLYMLVSAPQGLPSASQWLEDAPTLVFMWTSVVVAAEVSARTNRARAIMGIA